MVGAIVWPVQQRPQTPGDGGQMNLAVNAADVGRAVDRVAAFRSTPVTSNEMIDPTLLGVPIAHSTLGARRDASMLPQLANL